MAKKKTAKKEAPVTADEMPVEEYDATRYTPWTPGNMPVGGKSNSTEQLNDHPTEHNHSAEAISDIVDRFTDLRLYVPAANSCGVDGNLKVDGQIDTGPGKAVYFGGNWDDAFIANTTASGREYMNFGESAAGGARLRLYGPGDPSSPGDVLIYAGGSIAARFNKDRTTKLYSDLQVDGLTRAQNGTKTAPAYSFTSDPDTGIYLYSAGITSIACAGKNIANFGLDGVAFPEGLAEITGTAANLHIGDNGQIRRITDVAKAPTNADLSRLETVIETLTARIEELEARLKPAATDV